MAEHDFRYENLDVWRVALEVAHEVQRTRFPAGLSAVKSQAVRSSASICLNIAEAQGHKDGNRARHYRIALGSAEETAAALDVALVHNRVAQRERLGRICRMLQGLLRKC